MQKIMLGADVPQKELMNIGLSAGLKMNLRDGGSFSTICGRRTSRSRPGASIAIVDCNCTKIVEQEVSMCELARNASTSLNVKKKQ